MKEPDVVVDIASYQSDTYQFAIKLKKWGVKAAIVKVSEGSNPGTAYFNPKAPKQVQSMRRAGIRVHAYHYARFANRSDAIAEAKWFVHCATAAGISRDSVLAIDLEDSCLPDGDITHLANAFLSTVKRAGYKHVDVYTMASWVWQERLIPAESLAKNLWIANYGVTQPGVDRVGLWQFTNKFHGMNLDASYDFNGFYSRKHG